VKHTFNVYDFKKIRPKCF